MKYLDQAKADVLVATFVHETWNEFDILNLQDRFLTNGFHDLAFSSMEEGRHVMLLFLKSLNIYHDIACLSMEDHPLENRVFNVYQELFDGNFINNNENWNQFEQFFLENFYVDFLWIEASQELCSAPWYKDFEKTLQDLSLDKQLPIFRIRCGV